MKVLVIVDMQNDFIDGALANKEALASVDKICDLIRNFKGLIVFTRDTHDKNYLETKEGKNLPIVHCLKDTYGWQINSKIYNEAEKNKNATIKIVDKTSFGSIKTLYEEIELNGKPSEILLCGTCTDICVISNALILKAYYPEVKMAIVKECSSGLTIDKHNAALDVMSSCQIEII